MSEESMAILAAQNDFQQFANKDHEIFIAKYVEVENIITSLINKNTAGYQLTDIDFYNYEYAQEMSRLCSSVIVNKVIESAGYIQDSDDIWIKKRRGFFR